MLNLRFARRTCALLLVGSLLLVGGCGKKNDQLLTDELVDSEAGFGLDEAKVGELRQEKKYSATVVFPQSATICGNYNGVILESFAVQAGDKVKKGDLLVNIQPITDETIAKQEAAIEKNLAEFNSGVASYNSQIASYDSAIASASGTQQQIYVLEKQKLERQLQFYQEDGQSVQQDMKEELDALKSIKGDVNIYAPYDCVIDSVLNVPEGTELTTTRELLKIHSEENNLIYVSEGGSLMYNMEVTVEAGLGDKRTSYKGRVVSANNVLDDEFEKNAAYVKLDEKVDAENLKSLTVVANVKRLNNVLLVKNFAVSNQNDVNYVSVVEGDKIMKRPVVVGAGDGTFIWIVRGLEAGQKVLIQ